MADKSLMKDVRAKLAIDMREFRRGGTGIGRWLRNFLDQRKALAPDVPIIGVGAYRSGIDAAVRGPRGLWCGATLNSMIRSEGIGLWLSPYFKIPPMLRVPCYATVHDTIPARILHRKWVFSMKLRWTLRNAKRIITVSDASRLDLVDNWNADPQKIILAKNSFGKDFTHVASPRDARILSGLGLDAGNYFLVVSDDRPHKNLSVLIEAFRGRETRPIVLVGTKRSDLDAPFIRIDTIDDRLLAALYRNAAALMHPAIEEGFGLPALEAMACGTPAILSDIPPLKEIGGNTAVYVSPLDVDGWRRAIEHPPSRRGCVQRAMLFNGEATYRELWESIRNELSS